MVLIQIESMIKLQSHFIEYSISLMVLIKKEMIICLTKFQDFRKIIHIKKNCIRNGIQIGKRKIKII